MYCVSMLECCVASAVYCVSLFFGARISPLCVHTLRLMYLYSLVHNTTQCVDAAEARIESKSYISTYMGLFNTACVALYYEPAVIPSNELDFHC